jgi:spermidine/putrescine transport system permease protein
MIRRSHSWVLVAIIFFIFLLAPLLLVVLFAFTNRALTNFPIDEFSLRWWRAMLDHPQFAPSLRRSLTIGGSVAVVSAVVGTAAAAGLARLPRRSAAALLAVLSLPMMLPFVILVVYAQLRDFDVRILDSARDLGASPLKAFATITLPIIAPTVLGAALLAVAISFDDFVITFFTIGSGNTLPTLIWGMMRSSVTPMVNAIGTLILTVTILSTLLGLFLTRYRG